MTATFMDFVQRFQNLRVQQNTGDKLIEDLLIYCQDIENALRQENHTLKESLKDAQLDLAAATTSRRDLQQRVQKAEAMTTLISEENDDLKNRNPYVLILIDGDGLIFKEQFIKQGLEGGKKAAYALRAAVAEYCRERAHQFHFIAKVFANVSGLGKAMLRDGSLDSVSDLKDFTLGFTQAKASFDFVDVGYGKERADSKIKELTRWNLQNHNCKQILLGISHDAGYAPFLDEVMQDDRTRQSISILEGYPTVREIANTDVNIINLTDNLFRSDKLVARPLSASVSAPPLAPIAPPPPQSTATSTPATSNASISPAPQTTASYANVMASASPPPQLILPLASKPNPPTRQKSAPPSWKPGPRGLDDPIAASQQAVENIKKRRDNNKLCNNHYLRGPCAKGDACCFVHNYKPTSDEIKAIALLSRLNPCTSGQDCDVEDCIYGHHCPSVKDGTCGHPYCKFPVDAHPPGTRFKNQNIRDN